MSEDKVTLNNKETENKDIVNEFENLDKQPIQDETKNIDLSKTTTKGLRITEKTKARYNQAEKSSGLSQEDFTNKLLDLCDFFDTNDLSRNPELVELSNIVNRIPEIFTGLISKQKTYESRLISKYIAKIDNLNLQNEELINIHNEVNTINTEEITQLKKEIENIKAKSDLKIREQDIEIEKLTKENKEKEELLLDLKKNLDITKDSLDNLKTEHFNNIEKINTKSDEVNNLKEKIQELQNELLSANREKLDIESTIIEYKKQVDYYKMQIENSELKLKQQKEMYEERVEHYKSIIKL